VFNGISNNMNKQSAKIGDDDLPALHAIANESSLRSQASYLRLLLLNLACLFAAAALSAYSGEAHKKAILTAIAIALTSGAMITLLLGMLRKDKLWFHGRAVAESVKTISWRYMTCAAPFSHGMPDDVVDQLFVSDLQKFLKENSAFLSEYSKSTAMNHRQITPMMRNVRGMATHDRLEIYLRERIDDQRRWYSDKATWNRKRRTAYFAISLTIQLAAVVLAILRLTSADGHFDMPSVLATLATALIAWSQTKRYEDLSSSYSVAAQELGLIREQGHHVAGEKALSRFVGDSENAISREHTLWLARRDIIAA
jgi:SMODS and SLOG-associating 2TM effector domain 1/SMODS and SLOG-associating 2TM effector domain 3